MCIACLTVRPVIFKLVTFYVSNAFIGAARLNVYWCNAPVVVRV